MERITRHLSYANIMATVAVVFAMTGGAIAATGGFTAASSSIKACAGTGGVLKLQTGKKCKKGQKAVTWNQQGVPGVKGATGPSGIAGLNGAAVPNATNATNATTATTALTANNALSLGGIPASEFTRSDCDSETGQVKGFVLVTQPLGTLKTLPNAYNCSGEPVQMEQVSGSTFKINFTDNPAITAIATSYGSSSVVVNLHQLEPGEWEVNEFKAGIPAEAPFAILVL